MIEKVSPSALSSETLQGILVADAEKLGYVYNAEQLSSCWDAEKLGGYVLETQKLGFLLFDAGKLGLLDAEKLGFFKDSGPVNLLFSIEQLGGGKDMEQLKGYWLNIEKLEGTLFFDAESCRYVP
ncbi:MAG: hypothetical protein U1C46_06830 [Bacteroidales bacterium]|nr:hypothetical protein [Bacteroidales bacterium]